MARLPLHPLILIPAYLVLACIATFPMVGAQHYAVISTAIGVSGTLGLQVTWAVQAIIFVSRLHLGDDHGDSGTLLTAAKFTVFALLLCLAIVASYYGYLQWQLPSSTRMIPILKVISSICEVLAVLLFFSVFWISAAVICNAEEGGKVPAHRVVGTFLLLIYLVIGAPFIFARLKRLVHPPSDPVAA